ncbi:MAG: CDP-glucose 4,6-dehydratase [Magnetococcus sp. YQC-9]
MSMQDAGRMSRFSGARVMVIGHTGFKGSWLTLWLLEMGAQVIGVSLGIPTEPAHVLAAQMLESISDHRADIRDTTQLRALMKATQPDFVFHLAAQALVRRSYNDPLETWQTNTFGTINVLEALRGLEQPCTAILITSDKCYDNVEWVWGYRETDPLGGPDPYSASKGGAELAIRSYVRSFFPAAGMVRIGVGRAGNVIGGGDWAEDRIVPDCIRAWSRGESVPLRNPLATRPWQHVLEPLSGYLTLAMALNEQSCWHGEAYNFGPPAQQNHSVGELVSKMATHWEGGRWEDVSAQYGGPYESHLLKLNCDKALHQLKWRAVWDFDRTVHETVHWYVRYYQNPGGSIRDTSAAQIHAYIETARAERLSWAM